MSNLRFGAKVAILMGKSMPAARPQDPVLLVRRYTFWQAEFIKSVYYDHFIFLVDYPYHDGSGGHLSDENRIDIGIMIDLHYKLHILTDSQAGVVQW